MSRIIGVQSASRGLSVEVASGDIESWPSVHLREGGRARFHAWYLVPLGVGQFTQNRPLFGGSYAAVQVGLLAWHLMAWRRHADALDANDFAREPDLRTQRNLSAALFYSSMIVSVAEALLVGYLTGE